MSIRKPQDNLWFHLYQLGAGFFASLRDTCVMVFSAILGKPSQKTVQPNHFLASLHFLVQQFPKSFWKHPTGIGMGRSIGTLLMYFFGKRRYFADSTEKRGNGEHRANGSGFTLIEVMVSITLFSGLLIAAFSSFGNIAHLKNKIVSDVDIYEQLYVASEHLSTIIKEAGGIDYEEYFNRSLVGTAMSGGHYATPSGFGNFGQGGAISATPTFGNDVYLCRSNGAASVLANGCALTGAINTHGASQAGAMQRYGQYRLQFTDYNSRGSNDTATCLAQLKPGMPIGDQNCDGKIAGDADDESLGLGPIAFPKNTALPEVYLIDKTGSNPTRLILRLLIERDPDAPSVAPCDTVTGTGTGCIGRLQMLRLIGRDLGTTHGVSSTSYDGTIDTWECAPDFPCNTMPNHVLDGIQRYLPTGADSEWIDVFSKDINVQLAQFYLNPNLDYALSWKDAGDNLANSYLRMNLRLGYSWKKRKLIKLSVPEVNITTTLNLRK